MPETSGASDSAGRDGVEQGEEIALDIIREGEDLLGGVYCPSKDNFLCDPDGVAFAEILEEDWFFPRSVVLFVGSEEVVDGMKEM